ncbi:metal-dependent hydrolase [Sulfolobales archaeon HS-7]|nr:metal-dependent hydrolase [Sulfolobales archaeon HS-7]
MATLKWLGHACVEVNIAGKRIIIDPFVSDNPSSSVKLDELLKQEPDVIAVTHDHYDHMGDAPAILKSTSKTKLFAAFDLSNYIITQAGVNEDRVIAGNVGGYVNYEGVKLALTKAVHTSEHSDPTGVIVSGEGITLYHAGDTGLFSDMELIGKVFSPDYVMVPIGGTYTMDVDQAVMAVEMLKPRRAAIPIHYNTWPPISANPDEFVNKVKTKGYKAIILKPGETIPL